MTKYNIFLKNGNQKRNLMPDFRTTNKKGNQKSLLVTKNNYSHQNGQQITLVITKLSSFLYKWSSERLSGAQIYFLLQKKSSDLLTDSFYSLKPPFKSNFYQIISIFTKNKMAFYYYMDYTGENM